MGYPLEIYSYNIPWDVKFYKVISNLHILSNSINQFTHDFVEGSKIANKSCIHEAV